MGITWHCIPHLRFRWSIYLKFWKMTPRVSRTCQPFFPVSDIPWGKKTSNNETPEFFSDPKDVGLTTTGSHELAPPLPWHGGSGGWLAMEELALADLWRPKTPGGHDGKMQDIPRPQRVNSGGLDLVSRFRPNPIYGILAATKSEICRKAFILTHQRSSVVSVRT